MKVRRRGRHETGLPARSNAIDPGFHGVPAGPGSSRCSSCVESGSFSEPGPPGLMSGRIGLMLAPGAVPSRPLTPLAGTLAGRGRAPLGSRHDGTHRRIARRDRLGTGQGRPGGRRLRQRPLPRSTAGLVRAIPACRHRPGRRPHGGHGTAALGRRLQRLPARCLDLLGLPQAGHRLGDDQAADGAGSRPAHRPADRRRRGVLRLPRLPPPARVHVRHLRHLAKGRGGGEPGGRRRRRRRRGRR